jgi:hypothetical protein
MEDVTPVEDEGDLNITRIIGEMVNNSLANFTTFTANNSSLVPDLDEDGYEGDVEDGWPIDDGGVDDEGVEPKHEPGLGDTEKPVTTTTEKPVTTTTTPRPVASTTVTTSTDGPVVNTCEPGKEVIPCVPCKPCKSCRPCPSIKLCEPVACKPVACVPVRCQAVPCTPVDCPSPPAIGGEVAVASMTVPVALAVGAAATLLVMGIVAFVGFVIRYLPIYISGTVFIGSVLLTGYLSSRYPASARELGLRAMGLAREAATALVNRAMAALRGPNQVGSPFCIYCY